MTVINTEHRRSPLPAALRAYRETPPAVVTILARSLHFTNLLRLKASLLLTSAMEKSSLLAQNVDELKSLEMCIARNQQRLGSVISQRTPIVLLLKASLLQTSAMEKCSLLAQNVDELKSLEMCIARNQQRLGSVFGNFTRHHKKEATYPKLPKALRLSAATLDTEYEDVNIDKLIESEVNELLNRERHRTKHHGKEILKELDEASLSKSRNKVKKMYRDSAASNVNKLVGKGAKGGIFLTENCTTVIAQIGTTAILHCEVSDITENTVTWIRKKDYSLLSVGLVTYSADSRFFSAHGRHVKDWALHIRFATSADAGFYECQVPTHPPTSIFFKLVLVAAYAEIVGESEKIIHEGSMLRLVCVVKRSTEPPSYVFWYFENRMINYDLNGVSVHNGRQTSELVIGKAEPRHAGNYTCVPANAKAASVTVHVVQSETPAAMQHGNNSAASVQQTHTLIRLLVAFVCVILLVKENREFG
ncbi:immunoglobulin domain-containing protein [Phthorimaea operculella]|nr:immunoglobulin domain-containing protein [Phthorimaea operculella]